MQNVNQNYRIFGRTKGRSNKKINETNYFDLAEKYKVNKLNENKIYILDIGIGYGETTIYLSSKYPQAQIISCDKYINGNLNLLKVIEKKNIKNISLYGGNVHEILDDNDVKKFFQSVWIFFPDPWPKKKHNKRRLISDNFLKKIFQYIKKDGKIYIASDSSNYNREILKSIHSSRFIFKWINQNQIYLDIKDYFKIETKFYKKAVISGRKPALFILEKI